MENTIDDNFQMQVESTVQRPDFLKILCILSFVSCGLWILVCSLGSVSLLLNSSNIEKVWPQVVQANPQMQEMDPVAFFHQIGMLCIYTLIANVFSLIGVIMMWRLEKIGIAIYAIAELSTNFFSIDMGQTDKSSAGSIFMIVIDLVFIGMYLANMKHMNKRNANNFVQPGS